MVVLRMTRSEYMARMENGPNWKPGLDAILRQLEDAYGAGGIRYMDAASPLGRDASLEGFFLAASAKGYLHVITCGLTNINANGDAFGNPLSGWGYELTVKWPGADMDSCRDALVLLNRLANYMQVKRQRFRRLQVLPLKKLVKKPESEQRSFAGILFVADTELPSIETVHGRVDFMQVVNVTAGEIAKLKQNRHLSHQLAFNLQKTYKELQMDIQRDWDCLE